MRVGYIYKITSPKKRVYIGQTVNVKKRFGDYKRMNCKSQFKIYNSFRKHGVDKHTFEIIAECEISEMNKFERYYQDMYNVIGPNGLNLRLTSANERKEVPSDESRARMSAAQKKVAQFKKDNGIPLFSKESRAKARATMLSKGMKRTPEQIAYLASYRKGYKASAETRAKLSLAKKGVPHKNKRATYSQEVIDNHRRKITGMFVGEKSTSTKIILNTETGIYYWGSAEAHASIGRFSKTYIEMMVAGSKKNKTSLVRV